MVETEIKLTHNINNTSTKKYSFKNIQELFNKKSEIFIVDHRDNNDDMIKNLTIEPNHIIGIVKELYIKDKIEYAKIKIKKEFLDLAKTHYLSFSFLKDKDEIKLIIKAYMIKLELV